MEIILAFLAILHIVKASTGATQGAHFTVCPSGLVHNGDISATVLTRSLLGCVVRCSASSTCSAFNACHDDLTGRTACALLADIPPGGCADLTVAAKTSCRHGIDAVVTMCENGGSLDGQQCRCPFQFGGDRCQRYIRDCREAYENGYQSNDDNGVYLIQPATAPAPFKVHCKASSGLTMPFKRTTANFNVTWATAKEGINNDLTNDLNNFFIGLDNLHHLLLQAKYVTHVFTKYDNDWTLSASAFYSNLTIGVDSTFYSLTYNKFSTSANDPSDNGFDAAGPLLFAAVDRDPTGCAVANGGTPGWYGSDCGGYSLFADPVMWPVLGSPRTCMLTIIYVSRVGPLYDDE